MHKGEQEIFIDLFREVCEKCFLKPLQEGLKEPEAKHLSVEILEKTGLVIGWKSIKNFSLYATRPGLSKKENPSVATLDTLARYVMNIPPTDEMKRKISDDHYSYWFEYRSRFDINNGGGRKQANSWKKVTISLGAILIIALLTFYVGRQIQLHGGNLSFVDDFNIVNLDSLKKYGWVVRNLDSVYWNKRNQLPGHLTLHTIRGDNWSDKNASPPITNLLVREVKSDCFSTEVHLTNFVPWCNWQQAGILLSEDPSFEGKVLRLSIGYNDFFGGYQKSPEIIIQIVGSIAASTISKPEEIAHVTLFSGRIRQDSLIRNNLSKSALKIEKKGNHYRFLFTNGRMESFAFKEAAHRDFDIQPKYLALFAMQGLSNSENPEPVHFDSFSFMDIDCLTER